MGSLIGSRWTVRDVTAAMLPRYYKPEDGCATVDPTRQVQETRILSNLLPELLTWRNSVLEVVHSINDESQLFSTCLEMALSLTRVYRQVLKLRSCSRSASRRVGIRKFPAVSYKPGRRIKLPVRVILRST